ncbi:oxidoreductase [Erythrobacter sp. QSSC1-22B]|uniref:SDR family oxidoreductase n=1 Tax=Erythrobacter sp. QSSC1-22B TaxID=1860125 RepID=UPI0008054C8B|nr:SDR family oxidoreductase [Erythrobacter sp. QSSC1-22B]OBX20498.1 oxidoreductase [Erythrobacter sp. QSSC1-22B]
MHSSGLPTTRPAVLITGGARRIGAAIARAFGKEGWHVVIHYGSSREEAEALADSLPSAEIANCDLADGDASVALIERLASRLDDWQVLINCAGVFEPDAPEALDPQTNRLAMAVNAATPVRMAQAFLTGARTTRGRRVIQITDQKIRNPNPDFFSYTMSKHALHATVSMLSKARERAEDRVYGLAPGAILASHDQAEAETEISHRLNLLKRKTAPEEIASAALFLAQGWMASGQTLFVDSGQHLLDQDRDVIYLARELVRNGATP